MKRKFVKRIKRELQKLGCDKFERGDTTGWYKPKTYYLRTHYHGHILDTTGDTDLQAYKLALKLIRLEKEECFLTSHWLWADPSTPVILDGMYGFKDCHIALGKEQNVLCQ